MNRAAYFVGTAVVVAGPPVAGTPADATLCVSNASAARYHSAVRRIDPAARVGRVLEPGETLCLRHAGRGVVAAYETSARLEGCSRLVPAGWRETLLAFGRLDRCDRTGHGG